MIRLAKKEELSICLDLTKELGEFFNEGGIKKVEKDLKQLPVFVYKVDSIKGFVVLREKSSDVVEIACIAVAKNERRQGIGESLIKFVEENNDYKVLAVKTLDEKADYKPYVASRNFYEKNGFVKIDVIDNYQGWGKDNPCAIYVKPIRL